VFQDFQPLAAIATTPAGLKKLAPFCQTNSIALWIPDSLAELAQDQNLGSVQIYSGSLKEQIAQLWPQYQGFVFCLATGAVVRLIAPLLQHKSTDPAVVVVDESGQFVISLCSGHQGGADRLTQAIALQLNATPVLTGAANRLQLPGIDVLGVPFGWQKGTGDWTGVSAAIARQDPVQVIQAAGTRLWQHHLPSEHSFQFHESEETATAPIQTTPQARVWISPSKRQLPTNSDIPEVQWHPQVLWVGIGCERGTSRQLIESAIQQVCQAHHLAEAAIAGVATLDLKADEVGLVELCRDRQWPLRCFSAEQLKAVPVPTPSEVVASEVGTPSVAEAAALVGAGWISAQSDTVPLQVTKQIFRSAGQPGAVTIAIAQAKQEYTGRNGKLWLVGTGPG